MAAIIKEEMSGNVEIYPASDVCACLNYLVSALDTLTRNLSSEISSMNETITALNSELVTLSSSVTELSGETSQEIDQKLENIESNLNEALADLSNENKNLTYNTISLNNISSPLDVAQENISNILYPNSVSAVLLSDTDEGRVITVSGPGWCIGQLIADNTKTAISNATYRTNFSNYCTSSEIASIKLNINSNEYKIASLYTNIPNNTSTGIKAIDFQYYIPENSNLQIEFNKFTNANALSGAISGLFLNLYLLN